MAYRIKVFCDEVIALWGHRLADRLAREFGRGAVDVVIVDLLSCSTTRFDDETANGIVLMFGPEDGEAVWFNDVRSHLVRRLLSGKKVPKAVPVKIEPDLAESVPAGDRLPLAHGSFRQDASRIVNALSIGSNTGWWDIVKSFAPLFLGALAFVFVELIGYTTYESRLVLYGAALMLLLVLCAAAWKQKGRALLVVLLAATVWPAAEIFYGLSIGLPWFSPLDTLPRDVVLYASYLVSSAVVVLLGGLMLARIR